jgi:hypothetical protein
VLGLAALRLLPVFCFAIRPIWCERARVVKPVRSQTDVYGGAAR